MSITAKRMERKRNLATALTERILEQFPNRSLYLYCIVNRPRVNKGLKPTSIASSTAMYPKASRGMEIRAANSVPLSVPVQKRTTMLRDDPFFSAFQYPLGSGKGVSDAND